MRLRPRVSAVLASVVSLPLAAVALAAATCIVYSLVARSWYRDVFWQHGSDLGDERVHGLPFLPFVASAAVAFAQRRSR